MPQNPSHIESLFRKFSQAEASEQEVRELFELISQDRNDPELIGLLENEIELSNLESGVDLGRKDKVLAKIREVIAVIDGEPAVPAKRTNYRWLAVAAAVALVIFGAGLFYFSEFGKDSSGVAELANDVAPGQQGATLTLANGNKIRLSDAANGELARQAGVKVTKLASGQLIYELESSSAVGTDLAAVNTLSTAKGETYRLRLPDGSLVWLNAASSLTYSAGLLEGGVRKIKLAGEGYFEVAKDKEHPFVVSTGKQDIEVLGTHFNVNSYTDEQVVRTTLLEGSVRLNAAGLQGEQKGLVLKPGQQALMKDDRFLLKEIDPDVAVAWVNNKFIFEDTDVRTIMRMLERWYNVEVIYKGAVPTDNLGGSVSRFDNISSVLKILEAAGDIHFRLEGRKLYVSKS